MFRKPIVALAVAALAAAGAVTAATGSSGAAAAPFAAGVEDEGANCAVPTLPDQGALTTEELTALNSKVDADHEDPDQVAKEWLSGKGLA